MLKTYVHIAATAIQIVTHPVSINIYLQCYLMTKAEYPKAKWRSEELKTHGTRYAVYPRR
jgi:actin-related protein